MFGSIGMTVLASKSQALWNARFVQVDVEFGEEKKRRGQRASAFMAVRSGGQ